MRNRGIRIIRAAVLLSVLGAGCGSAGSSDGSAGGTDAKIRVVASTNVYGDIVHEIAGDHVEVTPIIINPDADPHFYEGRTQNQLALSKADVVIENGGGYDDFIDSMLKASGNRDATVLNVVDISGFKPSASGELNEHVWYDFPTIEKLVDRLLTVLSDADPDNAETFRSNAATFTAKLKKFEETEASIKELHDGEGVAITEPVPLYMLEACGLVNKTPDEFSKAIEEETGVSPVVLQETMELFSSGGLALLAYNEQTAGPETQKVLEAANENAVPVVPVTETLPSGKTYLGWMDENLSAIERALG